MAEQIKTQKLKPFRNKPEALELEITGFELDNQDEGDRRFIFPEKYLLELETYTEAETVSLDLEINYSRSSLEDLVPENEREDLPLELVVVARGTNTMTRKTVFREDIENLDEEVNISPSLDRERHYGKVQVKSYIVRSENSNNSSPYARWKGSKLATGKGWEVRFDKSDEVGNDGLEIIWEDFEKDDLPTSDDMLYYLRTGVTPKLYLNENSQDLRSVFHAPGNRGGEARMREVFYDAVVIPAHLELVQEAIEGLDRDTMKFDRDWQDGIVMGMSDEILHDKDVSGDRAKKEKILEIYQSDNGAINIMSRVQRAVQEKTDPIRDMEKLVEEVNEE